MSPSRTFTREQVSRHASENDLWIIIDTAVYDMTEFVDMHPGGAFPLLQCAGKDATEDFYGLHRQEVLRKYAKYKIGSIQGETPQIKIRQSGDLSKVPYAEPAAWMGFKSPYYNESHIQFRAHVRKIMDEFAPKLREFELAGEKVPENELNLRRASHDIMISRLGPGSYLRDYNIKPPGGLTLDQFDYFHELIVNQEVMRLGIGGLYSATIISLPTVLNHASRALRDKIIPEILSTEKRISLAITEPYCGSDVASIRTTAKRTPCGKFFIVNGVKKWISMGLCADYMATAVRTEKGISMLLIERGEGVETKPIKTSLSDTAHTAYVTFDNVKVPVEHLLGEENKGFRVIMTNFNHERWGMIASVIGISRLAVQECFKWAMQRKVFSKRLVDQPVIRNKLARMIASVEGAECWLEYITYQMCNMDYKEQSEKLAGPIAFCKYLCTRMVHDISDDACQIFGGRAVTTTGMGRHIEALQRAYKVFSIPGGSEEVMADLGVRQAIKKFPIDARL